MGSGVAIRAAIEKYGKENFKKDILEVFESEEEMYLAESKIVTSDFITREDVYNLTEGGFGGDFKFGSVARNAASSKAGKKCVEEKLGRYSEEAQEKLLRWLHSEENKHRLKIMRSKIDLITKERIKQKFKEIKHSQGENNSQFGTIWITNGADSKKINKLEDIPEGWRKGRVQKRKIV